MRKVLGILSIFWLSIIGCEEETMPIRPYPELNTLEVTNISENGAQFNAEVRNPQAYSIKRHGFVWSDEENPTLEQNDQVVSLDNLHSGTFTATIISTLGESVRYHVRAFIETDDYLVYGTNVNFVSLGSKSPVITSISPLSVNYCDTLYIRGTNFSAFKKNNKITFGQIPTEALFTSDTLLKVMVPGLLKTPKFQVAVSTSGNMAKFQEPIDLKKPELLNYDPPEVTLGAEFIVHGNNFPQEKDALSLKVNGINAEILENSCKHIKAVLPVTTGLLVVSISTIAGLEARDSRLTLLEPNITTLLPDQGFIGDRVEIQGSHFNTLPEALSIKVGNSDAEFQILSDNNIIVYIPEGVYPERETTLTVFSYDQPVSSEPFKILDPWIKKTEIPGVKDRFASVGFSVGDNGYVGLGRSSYTDFWKFSPSDNSWNQIADFPGSPRLLSTSFVIGNFAYVGGGWTSYGDPEKLRDFWRYDTVNDIWEQVASFPYPISDAVGMATEGVGYVCTASETDNFWSYDPVSNTWSQLPDLVNGEPFASVDSGFELGGDLYIYFFGSAAEREIYGLYQFSPSNNLWSRKADIANGPVESGSPAITIGQFGYIFSQNYNMYQYNSTTDSWKEMDVFYTSRKNALVFEIDEKAYFGGGSFLFDLWEYDPSYER